MIIPIYKNFELILDGEIWRDVFGYEGLYQVSNLGRVKIVKRNKIKSQNIVKEYLSLNVYKSNKTKFCRVHRLVANAFIKNIENKTQVNHKNGIKIDNRLENLEWATPSENQIHSFYVLNNKAALINIKSTYKNTTKIKEADVKYILERRSNGVSSIELSKELNVSYNTVDRIVRLNKDKYGIKIPKTRVSHQTKEQVKLSHLKAGKKTSKPILVYDINNIFIKKFNSRRDLQREFNVNRGNISRCLRGLIGSHKGLIFKNE